MTKTELIKNLQIALDAVNATHRAENYGTELGPLCHLRLALEHVIDRLLSVSSDDDCPSDIRGDIWFASRLAWQAYEIAWIDQSKVQPIVQLLARIVTEGHYRTDFPLKDWPR